MKEYNKIQTLYRRDLDAPGKPMREGDWTNDDLKYLADSEWVFTEKLDGTNVRIGHHVDYGVHFGGRTDSAQMPVQLLNYLNTTFTPELFKGAGLRNVTLYGEGVGAGIQKGGGNYGLNQHFVLFDVVIHADDQDWWLYEGAVEDVANNLGIDYVPTVGRGTLHDAIAIVKHGLQSRYGNFEAEGLVCRPAVQLFNRKGERIITKIKGRDFK